MAKKRVVLQIPPPHIKNASDRKGSLRSREKQGDTDGEGRDNQSKRDQSGGEDLNLL